jgi:serine/threonine protein kinase/tetratricopeptide (TPR) repeat protein
MSNLSPLEAVFFAALDKGSPQDRATYLDAVCCDNPDLRRRIEKMLAAQSEAENFLEQPASALGANLNESIGERPGAVVGAYKLLEQIGEGGFGIVFMAEQIQPVRRRVALKILKPGMDTRQVVARFEAERQALALMDHPNIARVFDGGATGLGRPYFVMELVKGVAITDYCDQRHLTPRQRLELFLSVCQAVQHAHQKGVIHRDLKPSNVLVTMHDTTPVVKVIDFGVAKALGQELTDKTLFTGFTQMLGTPMYMSPEQAGQSGLDVDTRSDVYALGVLLYELLTGTTPFDRERLQTAGFDEIRRIIREEEAPRPSTRLSTLGAAMATVSANRQSDPHELRRLMRGELDWVVMKALEKDRGLRYESASSFAADVRRYLNDEPVLACPPSAWYRWRKFARRHRAGVSIVALVLFFVVLIGSGAGWAIRDRVAREAELSRDQAARQARLNLEIGYALDEADKARAHALTLTDSPIRWQAALAEAVSDVKRAQGLVAQDTTAPEAAIRVRLEALAKTLNADETDRRFAARFEEVRLQQTEVNMAISEFKLGIAFTALKDAFQLDYGIAFGTTPPVQAAAIINQRPRPVHDFLVAALDVSLASAPRDDRAVQQWLSAALEAADAGPWRKRAQHALRARDWKALAQLVEEAVAARQPPSVLLGLVHGIPSDAPIRVEISRRIRQAYPGDFWANHDLAWNLHYGRSPRLEEAIRYYTSALALRPHNPAACVNHGNALWARGELDGAIRAYREALEEHPNYAAGHERLGLALEQQGDLDGAIAELHQAIRFRQYAPDRLVLADMLVCKGLLLERKGLLDEAATCYRKAVEVAPTVGTAHYQLGTVLVDQGDPDKAVASFREAIACDRKAIARNPSDSRVQNELAWFLVTCPHSPFRDPVEGVTRARSAVTLAPHKGAYWNTLGVAHYRTGNWIEAVTALTRATQLRAGGDGYDWFFLAMAHWQRGDRHEARRWFDEAVAWMDMPCPRASDLARFRAEAEELLKAKSAKD